MRPTVRSRLLAAGTAFVLGFVLANVGVLVILGPDRWLWVGIGAVFALTGLVGVLVADTPRPLSLWAVVGVEVLLVVTLLPLLWTFTVATASSDIVPRSLVPTSLSWDAFGEALGSGDLRRATGTSLLVAGLTTVVAMLAAVPAAYALVQRSVPGARVVYALFVAVLVLPVVALAGPSAYQLLDLGAAGSRLALVPTTLLVALPLALWLSVTVMRRAPWDLRDTIRADGATRWQELRAFGLPSLAPSLLLVAALVLVVTASDAVVGAALAPSPDSRPLPATLLLAAGGLDTPPSTVAAMGLVWLVPALVLLLVAPRRIAHLIGRTYR